MKYNALWKAHFPAFAACDDAIVKQLMDAANLVNLPAGIQLFYPGKRCENYLMLLSGSVKAQIMSDEGCEVLLYHVIGGDSCVLTTSCLLGGNDYPAEGITETEIRAFAIPSHVFQRCVDLSPFFRDFVFRDFSRRLSDVIRRMATIRFGTVEQKLARQLLASGDSLLQGTHSDLAAELATAREVVSRHLKRFESYGWLKVHRGSIELIDAAALRRLLEDANG